MQVHLDGTFLSDDGHEIQHKETTEFRLVRTRWWHHWIDKLFPPVQKARCIPIAKVTTCYWLMLDEHGKVHAQLEAQNADGIVQSHGG